MTDKEKLLNILNHVPYVNSLWDILNYYLDSYETDISAMEIMSWINLLNDHLNYKVTDLIFMKSVAKERATYLKSYLSGEMWLTEEAAKANIQPQINNAQAIIDACK